MPCTAMHAIIVAHARPLVSPGGVAAFADVVVAIPSHDRSPIESPLRPQPIVSARDEIEIAAVSQILELLTNFWFHIPVAGVNSAQSILKRIYIFDLELRFPEVLDALH